MVRDFGFFCEKMAIQRRYWGSSSVKKPPIPADHPKPLAIKKILCHLGDEEFGVWNNFSLSDQAYSRF
jgi:hypothetical protein